MAASTSPDVVIIGAGCAGLSAGVRLADAGFRVSVIEEAPRLGGRATAFIDAESGDRVDNGQHVVFGCYRETLAFLQAIGTRALAPLDKSLRLDMAGADGRRSTLTCPSSPLVRAPWHLVGGILRWGALPWVDRVSALRLGPFLRSVRRLGAASAAERVPADLTVSSWLNEHKQSGALCQWLWYPLALAALNQSPRFAAARPFARVIGELFGPSAEDSAIAVPSVPLDELYAEPAARHIEKHGGVVWRRTSARLSLAADGGHHAVEAGGTVFHPRVVISAVPWHAFGRLWPDGVPPALAEIADGASRTESVPLVTVNLWFDRPVLSHRFVGLVGTTFHWAFDKQRVFGSGATHVSMVASGAVDLLRLDNVAIAATAERDLRTVLGLGEARLVRSLVVREARATFSLAPGSPPRPGTLTPVRGFFLAGDWTDTGLPGTIEGAVLSGHRAADAVMAELSSLASPGLKARGSTGSSDSAETT